MVRTRVLSQSWLWAGPGEEVTQMRGDTEWPRQLELQGRAGNTE